MGERGKDQRLLNLWMKEQFIREIDAAVEVSGAAGRSQFIRDAIAEKMRSIGVDVPDSLKGSPSRAPKRTV